MPPLLMTGLLNTHAACTLMMTGLIWMVQLVHYPLFARVGAEGFTRYQREHTRRITWVVGPLMAAEGLTALSLLVLGGPSLRGPALAGLALLAIIWASTALLQVPCHERLSQGRDAAILARLVRTNWIRTAAWSIRGVLALVMLSGGAAV